MSEIEALLGLYGAIDRAVVAGEADVEKLGTLLGAYRSENGEPTAIGWYDSQYRPWVEGVRERAEARATSKRGADRSDRSRREDLAESPGADDRPDYLAEALVSDDEDPATLGPRAQEVHQALANLPAEPLEGRMVARRLLAVTAAAQALPDHFGRDGSHAGIAKARLVVKDPERDSDPPEELAQRAQQLQERFADRFKSMSDWSQVVGDAIDDGLLPRSFRSQQYVPPCRGRLIMRPDPGSTDPDPCTVMEAGFVTNAISFAKAKAYLEPSNWVYPGSFWCRMERDPQSLGPNSWLYHETVSTDCTSPTPAWSVSADLQFWFSHPAVNEARVEYDFPGGGPPPPLSDIEIDEGSLRIIDLLDGRIEVITTKRVRFAGSFDGAGLSMFMCATGYSTKLEDMIFTVAAAAPSKTNPFPVPAPTKGPIQGGTVTTPSDADKAASYSGVNTGANEESLEDVVKEATAFVEASLKDVANDFTSSMNSVQAGTYKVENAWADGLKMWSRCVTGLSKALDLGTRATKAAAKPPSSGSKAAAKPPSSGY